ncbi:MAG: hypothetical protein AAF657_09720 [Acidobacteriota bacterium]
MPATAHPEHDPDRVGWSRIELEATKLFVTARSEVDLGSALASEVDAELIVPEASDLWQPNGAASYLLTLRTTVLGQESRVRFLFEPENARALQRSELSISKKRQRHRTYRYAAKAVHTKTLKPGEGESGLPFGQWSQVQEKRIALPSALPGDVVVTEAAALLYAIPAGDLEAPGDRLSMHVFSRGHVSPVDVSVRSREQIRVDYEEVSPTSERNVAREVEALRVALRPGPPVGGGAGEERRGFKLLGLEGDIDLYLDPQSRALLLVTGKIKVAGRVQLRARRVVLR